MSGERVIADARSLIALNQIDRLDILQQRWSKLVVPPAVSQEIARSVPRPDWLVVRPLQLDIGPDIVAANLGPVKPKQ